MIQVTEAKPSDAATMAEIHKAASTAPWDHDAIRASLENPSVSAGLAHYEGRVAGFVIASRAGDEAEVLQIAVHPRTQRHGLAKALIISVSKQMVSAGVTALFLEVAHDNAPAIGLYEGLGFAQVGQRKAYYRAADGTRKDALLYRLALVE